MLRGMTSRLIGAGIAIISLFAVLLMPAHALAADLPLESQLPPVQLPDSPLYVTGYYTETLDDTSTNVVAASQLRYVEIYNNSNEPISLEGWKIETAWSSLLTDGPKTVRSHALTLSASVKNYLPPKNYVIVSFNDAVTQATFSTQIEDVGAGEFVSMIRLQHADFKPYEVTVNDIKLANKAEHSARMRLSQTTTGYTSTGRYVPDDRASVYDNGLYIPRDTFEINLVEIVANSRHCAPNDTGADCSDYIKFYNSTNQPIDFADTRLRIGYQGQSSSESNTILLAGVVQPGDYITFSKTSDDENISITNSGGFVWLEDKYGMVIYPNTVVEYADASSATHKGQSWARDATGQWRWALPQPFGENVFLSEEIAKPTQAASLPAPCRSNQYRSTETNRCRNIVVAESTQKACEPNQYRSSETNRCRNITSTSAASLTPCKPGQVRNSETNRCRAIASTAAAELKPCAEGKVRSAETNRCRNASATVLGDKVGFAVEKTRSTGDATSLWALGGIGALIVGYGVWEWRFELISFLRKGRDFFTLR